MKRVQKRLLLAAAITALLAGCDGGGVSVESKIVDNSVDNSVDNPDGGSTGENPCATIERTGVQGVYESGDCRYGADFVSASNPLTEDLYLPTLVEGGAHIFEGILFVGENHSSDVNLQAAGIAKGGDSVKLEIQAGATIAFKDNSALWL
ncbi:hypothetical protein [Microbulbifer epialgicus]|uniref:Lipoprotein n=1 Tax=Microbulbifer epialgicus TaxID=393907 RepID=A0ABV4P246_9GAMM